ncbi:Hypothetical Protein FCC1311_009792 [Hondaea fermentalgiana]|uniref:Uncharacterized protein n=1 Tax=Hondaea fermentalgiana TaxID=2315210 RepID=A0A2R5G9L4_9STRA|nr:Hypothetical Protein FCC1311_009792 [Hondaea fermentalgiana]|eukprot:GBG24761.1 Hypothetical Protein FCC1311_009792 [Hondaea fermentalgiana]
MSRSLLLVACLALLTKSAFGYDLPAECDIDDIDNAKLSCAFYYELRNAFQGDSWSACKSIDYSKRICNQCPGNKNWITCSSGLITSFAITSEQNFVLDTDYDLTNLNAVMTAMAAGGFETFTLQNQASAGMTECFDACSDVTCDFSSSDCSDSCTTNGVCPTSAPTDAVATPAPTDAAATPAPTDAAATPAPTDAAATPAPTELATPAPTAADETPAPTDEVVTTTPAPTAAPTAGPTTAPTDGPTAAPTDLDVDDREEEDPCSNSTLANCTMAPTPSPSGAGMLEVGVLSFVLALSKAFW